MKLEANRKRLSQKRLLSEIAIGTGEDPKVVYAIYKDLVRNITAALSSGVSVYIEELGSFRFIYRKPCVRRNIHAGIPINVPGYYKIVFLEAAHLKEKVRKSKLIQERGIQPKEKKHNNNGHK